MTVTRQCLAHGAAPRSGGNRTGWGIGTAASADSGAQVAAGG